MYSILKPEQDTDVDSEFVEFFHKKNGTQEIIVLINHSNASQETVIKSKRTIQLKNKRTNEEFDQSKEFFCSLKTSRSAISNNKPITTKHI